MNVLVGDNTETGTTRALEATPSIFATEFTASASGPCTTGYFYTTNTSGTVYLVVYSSTGSLIAQSEAVTLSNTITGWVECTFASIFNIDSGTQYWVGPYLDGSGWILGLGAAGSARYDNNGGTWPTAPSSTAFTVRGTGEFSTSTNISAYLVENTTVPTITAVNSGNPIADGSTAVPFTGTNFASGMTASIAQGANTVAQANVVYTDATDGKFDLVMEPPSGPQLAATDAVYSAGFEVTAGGNTSTSLPVQLTPPTGVLFKTLLSILPTAPMRFETLPDLAVNDQVWAAGNSTGTAAAPAGLVLNSDGSFEFAPGYTPQDFWVRVYIAANSAYTPWAEITVTGSQSGGFW